MNRFARLILKIVMGLFIVTATLFVGWAFDARRMPELELWHLAELSSEFKASDKYAGMTLSDYLKIEESVFLEFDTKVLQRVAESDTLQHSRYAPAGAGNAMHFEKNYNRTFELRPTQVRGGVLLLHGLTDSPYSLQKIGKLLADQGFYCLGLRLPGHGTIPAALKAATWQDWLATVELGAAHVQQQIGGKAPLWVVGYSNGGALAVKYTLDCLEDRKRRVPDRLVLISPAIGITPFAVLTRGHELLSFLPYFEKFKWVSIQPEFDPYKYNSFPKNAGDQAFRLAQTIQKQMDRLQKNESLERFPSMLTFQSLVDSTVQTDAVVKRLYDRLPNSNNELVLFDINRLARLKPFIKQPHNRLLNELSQRPNLPYRLTIIRNSDNRSPETVAATRAPGAMETIQTRLGLEWPVGVYSLSHVALTFAMDNPVYGMVAGPSDYKGLPLGRLSAHGERNVLDVDIGQLMRLRCNPFFEYLAAKLEKTAQSEIVAP